MIRSKALLAIAAVLVAGAALGYWLGNSRAQRPMVAAESGTPGRKILYWHDPMVPNVKFDKPGKSPFMDMQLAPVYADDQSGGAAVRVSPAVAQNLGVRLGIVERVALRPKLMAVGSVAFDERLVDVVQARVEGYVTRLHVKAPLVSVRRGQALAEILSPQWLSAQEEYLALLHAQSQRGQSIRDAARQRLSVLGVPEETIRTLERERATNPTTTVYAPSDGVVTELSVREGATFMPGAPLFRVNGLKTVWVNAQVPEAQVSLLPVGATVSARATAWPGTIFEGRVMALLPEVDAQTRTLTARLELKNPELKLAPGMFVSLEFTAPATPPQLVVPSEAVIMTGARNVVIVARERGGFDVAEVKIGAESDGKTVVLSGLTEGQSIVRSGQFLIDSEASLRSTVERLSGPQPAGAEPRP
jgi:Cu(I)/Ag(I) efflux system membrane fusion protein